jgi:hypothetical protein
MKNRCYNKKDKDYPKWGGRKSNPIKIEYKPWKNDPAKFIKWSVAHGWKKGLTIERRDNNRGYAPWNCYFATYKEQNNNNRNNIVVKIKGKEMTFMQAWEKYGKVPYATAWYRYRKLDWSLKNALLIP